MASKHLHVADFAAALADGTIPGAFDAGRARFDFPPVDVRTAHGKTNRWRVSVALADGTPMAPEFFAPRAPLPPGLSGVFWTTVCPVKADGACGPPRRPAPPTIVYEGKNAGKASATNALTQAFREALSLYNKRRRTAPAAAATAAATAAAAADAATAAAAAAPAVAAPAVAAPAPQPPPMLLKRLGEGPSSTLTDADFRAGITVQRKYNGVRVVAYCRGGEVVLYSRTAGEYPGLRHIRAALAPALCGRDGLYLDGELYRHGKSLAWISGQARRAADDASLEYVVYDCFFPAEIAAGRDRPGAERQRVLDGVVRAGAAGPVVRAENFPARTLAEAEALRDRFLREGYEGAVLRRDAAGYRYGANNYHSSNVLKLKPLHDAEFRLVGYTQGDRGKDVGAVVWVCEVDPADAPGGASHTFNVVPKDMTYAERYCVFRKLGETDAAGKSRFCREFRGRMLTVQFPERSAKTGKPVQAKAVIARTYEAGPAADPFARLLAECRDAA